MDILQAKLALPLPVLMLRLGLGDCAKKSARCPFHEDHDPSFSIFEKDGKWFWKCHGKCGASGDEITFLEKLEGLSRRDAIKRFSGLALGDGTPSRFVASLRPIQPASTQPPRCDIDWHKCVQDLASNAPLQKRLASWRGYDIWLVWWMLGKELIGLYGKDGKRLIAFPVWNGSGLSGVHRRKKSGRWEYCPTGVRVTPLVIGDLAPGKPVYIFESQWDAFAFVEAYGGEENYTLFVTRGSSNGIAPGLIPTASSITLWSQRDDPAVQWVTRIRKTYPRASVSYAPDDFHDLNDWLRAEKKQQGL